MLGDRVTKVTLIAAVSGYVADMQKAQNATAKVGKEAAETAEKLEKQHQAMTQIGVGVAAVGAIAAVAFGLAVSKFAEFDQAMSNVKAATQETTENMGKLREAALEAGASTVFSATEAANAIEELGKAGLTTEQILGGGLKGALSLAAAGALSVADAAGIAAIAVKQFKLEGEDVPHVADLLAAGAGKAVGDVKDLADALNQAGLIAHGAGQSIEDTTGVLSAFADAGLKGSDAGTSLKTALIALQAPTDKARDVMEKYHLSFYNTNGQMLSFDKIAGQLKGNLNGLTDETRNAALAQIFGNDALRVANVLYDQGADGIQKYIDQTNDSGYAAKVAADRLNNLSGDVEKLGGAIDTALIRSGSAANDSLRTVTQAATGIVDAVGSLPQPILTVGLALTGLVGVVGLVGGAALIAVPKVAQFKSALSTLNVSGASAARGIGLASGALALAGVAFGIWAQRQAEATSNTAEFKDTLDETTGAITDYTRELVAKKLAEQNAFEAAKEAGITQQELTDAVIEGGDKLAEATHKLAANTGVANQLTFFTGIGGRAAEAMDDVVGLSGAVVKSKQSFKDQAEAAGDSAEKTTDAATAYQDAADQAATLQANLKSLIDTINESNGIGQDAVSTNAAFRKSMAGIQAEVDRQKAAYEELHGTLDGYGASLDETTEAGSENAAMLSDVAEKAQAAADAQFLLDQKTMSAKDATDKYAATLADQRKAFEDSASAAGFNADQVQALADKVFALPDSATIQIVAQTADTEAALQRIKDALNYIQDKRPVVGVGPSGGGREGFATGGLVRGPGTGTSDSIPAWLSNGEGIATASAMSDPSNRAALDYINRGGKIRGYADGGFVQPQYATNIPRFSAGGGGGSAISINQVIQPAPGLSEEQIGRISAERTAFALRGN
jgi:TP901 family phage tail tape measure protein